MRTLLAVVSLAAATVAMAQEGFPLDGTWRGERKGPGGTPVTQPLTPLAAIPSTK